MANFDLGYAEYEDDEVKASPIQLMGDHSAEAGQTNANILCCQCGTTIAPNPTNMCVQCLSGRCDITEGIATQVLYTHTTYHIIPYHVSCDDNICAVEKINKHQMLFVIHVYKCIYNIYVKNYIKYNSYLFIVVVVVKDG